MIPLARPRMFPTPVDLPPSWVIVLPDPPKINKKFRFKSSFVLEDAHRHFKDFVQKKMLMMSMRPYVGNVKVKIDWYRARKAGDVDGIVKVLLDSLQGEKWGAYKNDSQVKALEVQVFDTDRFNPRVEVTISSL